MKEDLELDLPSTEIDLALGPGWYDVKVSNSKKVAEVAKNSNSAHKKNSLKCGEY